MSLLKYLDDNLNNKYEKEMDEYKKYVKLFYTKNSKCPVDNKTILEKKEDKNTLELSCKLKSGKIWKATVTKPTVLNLIIDYENLQEIYKNDGILFKNELQKNLNSSIVNTTKDKDIENKLAKLKDIEKNIDDIKEVFNKQKNELEQNLLNRQEIIKKLATINIKKQKTYKNCPPLEQNVVSKLKEIAKNEKTPTEQRFQQIAKNTNLSINDVKNWHTYFILVFEYLQENHNLQQLNENILKIKTKYDIVNRHFITKPPTITLE